MDRPISAARWSTRETERERRENERAGESSPPMAWYAADEKRRGERSWSGRSPANRRTRGGPVRPRQRNPAFSLSSVVSSRSLILGYCTNPLLANSFPRKIWPGWWIRNGGTMFPRQTFQLFIGNASTDGEIQAGFWQISRTHRLSNVVVI